MDRERNAFDVLLVEDDPDIRELVASILTEEGYVVEGCADPAIAEQYIEERAYDLIVTDLFPTPAGDLLHDVSELRAKAHPTPVMIMTAHRLDADATQKRGFCAVLAKPFDLDELLVSVSACLDAPLDPRQTQQAQVVRQYFDALSRRDWDGFVDLCAPDIIYTLPGTTSFAQTIIGRAALRIFTEESFGSFPGAQFEHVRVYATPRGLAARYQGRWRGPDGREARQSGAVLFEFTEQWITRIGVNLNAERLETLARFQQAFGSTVTNAV